MTDKLNPKDSPFKQMLEELDLFERAGIVEKVEGPKYEWIEKPDEGMTIVVYDADE